jgi:formylglycine-generating enzyme required for sulfatase activity
MVKYNTRATTSTMKVYRSGLFDLHGNLWEWCQDWLDENYYNQSPRQDPQGPQNGIYRVLRGGSWLDYGPICRSAYRGCGHPDCCEYDHGFRVVCLAPKVS